MNRGYKIHLELPKTFLQVSESLHADQETYYVGIFYHYIK